jgi:hypothetical protein
MQIQPIQSLLFDAVIAEHHHLSHDTVALVWRRAGRRCILSTIRRLRRLEFDTILLLTVEVALVCAATVAIVSVVGVVWRRIRRCRGGVVILSVLSVGVVWLSVGAVPRTSGPSSTVEGLATGFATTTCC